MRLISRCIPAVPIQEVQRARLPQRLRWVAVLRVGRQRRVSIWTDLIDSFTESGDRENPTLTITYNANTGCDKDRVNDKRLRPQAAMGMLYVGLRAYAVGWSADAKCVGSRLILMLSRCIPASPTGTITATITLGGSATDWMAAKSGDEDQCVYYVFCQGAEMRPIIGLRLRITRIRE